MLALADGLTSASDYVIPTNLGDMAKQRLVQAIEFRPLLVDGGLSVVPNGFRIYVRCNSDEGPAFTACFNEDGTGKKLPLPVAIKARYTIAHEIAHTLLFNIETRPPVSLIFPKNARTLRGLEHACNDVAGALLLPRRVIKKQFRERERLLDPTRLSELCDRSLISRHGLVFRLGHLKREDLPIGVFASLKLVAGSWIITAVAKHYSLDQLFGEVPLGSPLQTLLGESAEDLLGGIEPSVFKRIAGLRFYCRIEPIPFGSVRTTRFITLMRD